MIDTLYVYKRYYVSGYGKFSFVGIVENFISVIWHEKFYDKGEFELVVPFSDELFNMLQPNFHVFKQDYETSDGLISMIIKTVEVSSDEETGEDIIKVTGTSSNEIIERRIILNTTKFYNKKITDIIANLVLEQAGAATVTKATSPEEGTYTIELQNVISCPNATYRSMKMFILKKDVAEIEDTLTMQIVGKNLLEAVKELCLQYKLGFRVLLTPYYIFQSKKTLQSTGEVLDTVSKETDFLRFQILKPADRSDYIIFADEYDNIYKSTYMKNLENQINFVLVAGKGEGEDRKKYTFTKDGYGTARGEEIYEAYCDLRDSDDTDMTEQQYKESLKLSAIEQYGKIEEAFDTELHTDGVFKFGKDFFLGDYVTIRKFGKEWKAQVIENIESLDENGYRNTPIFAY